MIKTQGFDLKKGKPNHNSESVQIMNDKMC